MSLTSQNPQFAKFLPDWILVQDCFDGERAIKEKTTDYLPVTTGMKEDGYGTVNTDGQAAYDAYVLRARYPGFLKEAVETAIGMMHKHPAEIDVPDKMMPMLEKLSTSGESAQELLRKINRDQILLGRIGLLLDFPIQAKVGEDLPFVATYHTSKVHNWDEGSRNDLTDKTLNLVVLNESEFVRGEDFGWEFKHKYRVLILGDADENERVGTYKFGVFTDEQASSAFDESVLSPPVFRGKTFDKIPFVFVNSIDLVTEPTAPPLLDLANLTLTIYRGEADYRLNLFMQGQDTFVIIGGNPDDEGNKVRIGANAFLGLPQGSDAKYVGVDSKGLEEQREALKEDRMRAGGMGAGTLDTTSRERESGESLDTRIAARTADLNQIAVSGAAGLERVLKYAAEWMGEDPNEVRVTPNLEFGEMPISSQSMVELSAAKANGWPISTKTLHELTVKRRFTKKTFEQEVEEIEAEKGGPFDPMEKAKAIADLNPDNTGPGQRKQDREE